MNNKQRRLDKINDILSYPGTMLYGTALNESTIRSIARRMLTLLKHPDFALDISDKYYINHSSRRRSLTDCWNGVINFLNGITDWDLCYGVNNPYLMDQAIIKDWLYEYAFNVSYVKESTNIIGRKIYDVVKQTEYGNDRECLDRIRKEYKKDSKNKAMEVGPIYVDYKSKKQ